MIKALNQNGYVIKNFLFSSVIIDEIIDEIHQSKKTENNFAIRQFIHSIPAIKSLIFNNKFTNFIKEQLGIEYFLIKAIYFDKPPDSNWIVPWHQDLMIVSNYKKEVKGFSKWRLKNDNYYVQPTIDYLENIVTIRLHLDDCTIENGALKIIAGSHKNGVNQKLDFDKEKSIICEVKKGGALVMKPLTYHASKRTENNQNRRVIHLEFASKELPEGMDYLERINFQK